MNLNFGFGVIHPFEDLIEGNEVMFFLIRLYTELSDLSDSGFNFSIGLILKGNCIF